MGKQVEVEMLNFVRKRGRNLLDKMRMRFLQLQPTGGAHDSLQLQSDEPDSTFPQFHHRMEISKEKQIDDIVHSQIPDEHFLAIILQVTNLILVCYWNKLLGHLLQIALDSTSVNEQQKRLE